MTKYLRLMAALCALAGLTLRAADAPPPAPAQPGPKRSGYAIGVEFYVDPTGAVTNATVTKSDVPALEGFALEAARSGQLNPQPLPPAGSDPQKISSEAFFPVESYDSGKPLPAGVVLPTPKSQPAPVYPKQYRQQKITGGVWLSIAVGKSGRVGNIEIIKASDHEFGPAAVQAVAKWQFHPATLNGKPIQVTVNLPVSFHIRGEGYSWHWQVAPMPSLPVYRVVTD